MTDNFNFENNNDDNEESNWLGEGDTDQWRPSWARCQPVYLQACELEKTLTVLLSVCDQESVFIKADCSVIIKSITLIKRKLFIALAAQDYLFSMESAASVRENACLLSMPVEHVCCEELDESYFNVFMDELETFRKLFKDWIEATRSKRRAIKDDDEWGLF